MFAVVLGTIYGVENEPIAPRILGPFAEVHISLHLPKITSTISLVLQPLASVTVKV